MLWIWNEATEIQKAQFMTKALADRKNQSRHRYWFLEMNQTGVGQVDADPDDLQSMFDCQFQELRDCRNGEVFGGKIKAVDQPKKLAIFQYPIKRN